jgi:hypothetical protein
VEWLKVKALSSSPSTAKKERKVDATRHSGTSLIWRQRQEIESSRTAFVSKTKGLGVWLKR